MCKVICFQFTCKHKVKLRKSRCGGTYHRVRRSGTSTACTAEAYIDIQLSTDCGPCQQEEWDRQWKAKLERAQRFLDKATELNMPGIGAVEELVKNLEDEYQIASWGIRTRFPPCHKGSVKKVEKGIKVTRPSQLAQEVRPEDVVSEREKRRYSEPERTADSYYWNSLSYDSGGNINYDNPLYNVDTSWVEGFLSESDDGVSGNADLDFTGGWGSACEWDTNEDTARRGGEESIQREQGDHGLFAWGPDAKNQSASAIISMKGLVTEEDYLRQRTDALVRAFWQVVESETANLSAQPLYSVPTAFEPSSLLYLPPKSASDHYYKFTNEANDSALAFTSSDPVNINLYAKKEEQRANQQSNCTTATTTSMLKRNSFHPGSQLMPSKKGILCIDLEPLRLPDISRFNDTMLQIAQLDVTEAGNKHVDPGHTSSPRGHMDGVAWCGFKASKVCAAGGDQFRGV